jgi:hypothetical protein
MIEREVLFFAVGIKDAANFCIFYHNVQRPTDSLKNYAFAHAASTFPALMG